MSARSRLLAGAVLFGCGLVLAAEDEAPDAGFLEYLGSWEESDEIWLMLLERPSDDPAETGERSDPVRAGEDSTETEDES